MGAEAPSGCAKKTEEGRVDDGEEEHIVSQENEIGWIAGYLGDSYGGCCENPIGQTEDGCDADESETEHENRENRGGVGEYHR